VPASDRIPICPICQDWSPFFASFPPT